MIFLVCLGWGADPGPSWGHIFSHVRPFYEWAVSNLDRSMRRSLWVLITHSSFIEGSHTTKNGLWLQLTAELQYFPITIILQFYYLKNWHHSCFFQFFFSRIFVLFTFSELATIASNRTVRIRHQCRKTTVLSCHRCLINTGVEKINNI